MKNSPGMRRTKTLVSFDLKEIANTNIFEDFESKSNQIVTNHLIPIQEEE